jgi:integrase
MPVIPNVEKTRFDELLEDVKVDYEIQGRTTLDRVKSRIRLHIEPFFRNSLALSITAAHINRFILKRQKEGAANAEINRELAIIRRAFTLAIENGKLQHRPKFRLLPEHNARTGFFEEAEFQGVLSHLPGELQPVLTFAYITGWRIKSEVFPLQWRQVDFAEGTVRLDPGSTKNRDGRVFPMTADLRQLLTEQRRLTEVLQREKGVVIPWVFHRNGSRIRDIRGSWKAACTKACVPGRIPHDLRRTAVRNLVRASIPERVAMTMTGHRTRAVFERYNIVSEGDLRMAAERLDKASNL